nr:hypothetical transcript [Hymenolepis microstoma]
MSETVDIEELSKSFLSSHYNSYVRAQICLFQLETSDIYATMKGASFEITIQNGVCYKRTELIGQPCYQYDDYLNITLNDATSVEELRVYGSKYMCIAKFVPNCQFKSVEPGNVIPQVSFPFVRFEEGMSSVTFKFSIKGKDYKFDRTSRRTWQKTNWIAHLSITEHISPIFNESIKCSSDCILDIKRYISFK